MVKIRGNIYETPGVVFNTSELLSNFGVFYGKMGCSPA
jgi:hypothetical protein